MDAKNISIADVNVADKSYKEQVEWEREMFYR